MEVGLSRAEHGTLYITENGKNITVLFTVPGKA